MTTHTKTPWHVLDHPGKEYYIYDEYGDLIGNTSGSIKKDLSTYQADAAFIVRAVNAHAQLVAACEDMLNVGMSVQPDSVIWNQIRTALKLAKGEE